VLDAEDIQSAAVVEWKPARQPGSGLPRTLSTLALSVLCVSGSALCKEPDRRSIRKVTQDLTSKDPAKRRLAASTLAFMGSEAGSATPALIRLIKNDSDIEARSMAVFAIGRIHAAINFKRPDPNAVVPLLIDLLEDGDLLIRRHAIVALGSVGPAARAALPPLRKLLKNEESPFASELDMAIWQIAGVQ